MRDVGDVVEDFEAEVAAALEHKAALKTHMDRMYEMLPDLRRATKANGRHYGPTDIEEMAHRLIPRDTISRVTAPVIGTSRKKTD